MIKELCSRKKMFIKKEFGKVLAGVLSCCMLLNGCGTSKEEEISWKLDEEVIVTDTQSDEEQEVLFTDETEVQSTEEMLIYVYVCGAVNSPGVYQVAEGSRLFEVIDAAGGMLEEADMTSQNLARVIQDGEQIQILSREEVEALQASGMEVGTSPQTRESNGLININTASVQELTSLTGIGESRAQAIVEYRETNGLFKSTDGIKKVAGIKDGLFEKIKNQITV